MLNHTNFQPPQPTRENYLQIALRVYNVGSVRRLEYRTWAEPASEEEKGRLSLRERFDWLVAPRSSSIQTSPVHTGRCSELDDAAQHLLDRVVRRPVSAPRR